jgi:hypothetical protein
MYPTEASTTISATFTFSSSRGAYKNVHSHRQNDKSFLVSFSAFVFFAVFSLLFRAFGSFSHSTLHYFLYNRLIFWVHVETAKARLFGKRTFDIQVVQSTSLSSTCRK